jgi:1,3-beta-glucan synthase
LNTAHGFDSALTGRSAVPFSGFKTPQIASARWNERVKNSSFYKKPKPVKGEKFAERGIYDVFDNYHDPYPCWSSIDEVPITRERIEVIFIEMMESFGFQLDNTKNMFDFLMRLLDSRASRMSPNRALRSLHSDYIGGPNSNFKKWYFSAQLDVDDTLGFSNADKDGRLKSSYTRKQKKNEAGFELENITLEESENRWTENMNSLSAHDSAVQLSLYLLCWGEANNIRFMPECLCFIFKCCNDYWYGLEKLKKNNPEFKPPIPFLDHVITPLYEYYRDQVYELVGERYIVRDRDHSSTIGYDDINQFFWHRKGLEKIRIKESTKSLIEIPPHERYLYLNKIRWSKCFYKTYKERRTWSHAVLNFNRIWIIHISIFWIYTLANSSALYTKNYQQQLDNKPPLYVSLTILALNGSISTLINLLATGLEYLFVPRRWPGAQPLARRFLLLLVIFIVLTSPTLYVFGLFSFKVNRRGALGVSITQFILSSLFTIYFAITPLASLFGSSFGRSSNRDYLASQNFTNSIHKLQGKSRLSSLGLWFAVFAAKLIESYFFLTLSLKDPIRELSLIRINRCVGEKYIGAFACRIQPRILLFLMILTDLALFFLDTYLWYIVCNTFHSVCRSLYIGVSIWTPWRNIFSRLPKRIFSKVVATTPNNTFRSKILVSQVWNAIIIAMYREHLLSLEHVQRLIYQQVTQVDPNGGQIVTLKEPNFFMSQEDEIMKSPLFESQSEAQRRITYFAQSLSTPMPDPVPVAMMPTFSALIPHFSEKITLTLREIIREEEGYSNVTLLEYLKKLHESEWKCFVHDTKMLAEENDLSATTTDDCSVGGNLICSKEKANNLPFYTVGFKSATPEYILRTRIWASLRSQTLYRTISGFMNYSRAIKLMYDVENPGKQSPDYDAEELLRMERASIMALRKFRMVISMQRMKAFTPEESEDKELILRAYPELQISYLDEEIDQFGNTSYYSCLIDGSCPIMQNGQRQPKYKVRLSGNPILGDGKSDNQNHALIFCRGEYIQLIDANQDNYLEECLKIRSVLAEFEEMEFSSKDHLGADDSDSPQSAPVAIVGTREYIFSENIGILGDVAAGKEQTFGTLFARTLARIGAKLHYGHPDFLNTVFMTTRGGVSKAQKGLHLNEDIYAGMNAILRGGRIKHCEYMQCGKGRDLGFGSILNFNTKIGAGMGEQMLSREYYYLGTQLSLDRFLSFYYAHPGFHLNNVFIIFSIQLFLVVTVNLAALLHESVICEYNPHVPITDPRKPTGCSNLIPMVRWLERSILSIFVVFSVSFIPLCVQELTERGVWRAFTRLSKHLMCLSPMFEVFVCKIYSQSLVNDLSFGGARYIATGRGFATVRVPFHLLYSRFSSESFYFAASALALLLFCSLALWNFALLYFWLTIFSLLIAPCLYNPNQFSWNEFFLDYKQYLKWLSSGNTISHTTSWIGHVRAIRIQVTGSKRKKLGRVGDKRSSDFKKPSFINMMTSEIFPRVILLLVVLSAYLFMNSQNEVKNARPANSILRVIVFSFGPVVLNAIFLLVTFIISIVLGPIISLCIPKFPSVLAAIAHTFSIVVHVLSFELLWFTQNWDFKLAVLGAYVCVLLQDVLFKMIITTFLTREFKHDRSNRAWWSGKWFGSGLGWGIFTQPVREYLCKIIEMSMFVADFFLGHFILFIQIPVLLIPYINRWHSLMLFWLRPDRQIHPQILSSKKRRQRRVVVHFYAVVFLLMLSLMIGILLLPNIVRGALDIDLRQYVPIFAVQLLQPESGANSKKGLAAYYSNASKRKPTSYK